MKRSLFIIIVFLSFFTFLSSPAEAFAVEGRLDPAIADSLAGLTADPHARAEYYSRAWLYNKVIFTLEKAGLNDAETLWRLARARIDIGENLAGDAALRFFEQAMDEAQRAVELDPGDALAWQTLATACGRVALFKGVFKSLGLVKRVHESALKSVALGDSVPVALYILGRTHKKLLEKPAIARKLLGLGWVDKDSVVYYFDKALDVSGGNMVQCHTEYGEFLLKTKKDKAGAKKMLLEGLDLPLRDEQDEKSWERAESLIAVIDRK